MRRKKKKESGTFFSNIFERMKVKGLRDEGEKRERTAASLLQGVRILFFPNMMGLLDFLILLHRLVEMGQHNRRKQVLNNL